MADCNAALAEDLDAGTSGARLFASNCRSCHPTPEGLAWHTDASLLTSFLQLHYTTSRTSASELAAYLTAIDHDAGARQPAALAPRRVGAPTGVQRDQVNRPPMALAEP